MKFLLVVEFKQKRRFYEIQYIPTEFKLIIINVGNSLVFTIKAAH